MINLHNKRVYNTHDKLTNKLAFQIFGQIEPIFRVQLYLRINTKLSNEFYRKFDSSVYIQLQNLLKNE